jgi:uncharacterized protein
VNSKRMLGVGGLAIVAVAVLGLMLALFSPSAATPVAQAQVTPPPNGYSGISVNGTGIISVQPDVVRMTIGVQEQAATVAAAQTAANDKAKKITDALKAAGVKAEDIKTANYGVAPQYRYDNNNNQPPTLVGYVVSSQYAITVRDITKAGSTIDAATAAGANSIYGITFTLEDSAKALEQARTAAMDDALVARCKSVALSASSSRARTCLRKRCLPLWKVVRVTPLRRLPSRPISNRVCSTSS